jgi:hypothetical protein
MCMRDLLVAYADAVQDRRGVRDANPFNDFARLRRGALIAALERARKAQINKTDRNDARGIAQMMRVGFYRPVHVKTLRRHAHGPSSDADLKKTTTPYFCGVSNAAGLIAYSNSSALASSIRFKLNCSNAARPAPQVAVEICIQDSAFCRRHAAPTG